MRILLTADPEIPVPPKLYGGIERIVDMLVRELRARDHEVGLVAHRDSRVPVANLFAWPGRKSQVAADAVLNTLRLWRAVRRFKPDVLHSFSRALYLLPLLRTPLPKIMSYQRQPTKRQVSRTAKLGGKSVIFTGCSEHISREGRAGGGTWETVHNCVETSKYVFQPVVAGDAPLVFLSRVERVKGAHTAIAVARRTERRLLIAGNHGESGEERDYWEREIMPYLGERGVEYVGAVDDQEKNALLGQAAAMIVPVEWDEPFGIVFAESLACGTPVISCRRGALPEIVRHGVDGFLVTSVEEACAAVRQLPEIDRRTCRARAEACFSSQVIAAKYEGLYHRLRTSVSHRSAD